MFKKQLANQREMDAGCAGAGSWQGAEPQPERGGFGLPWEILVSIPGVGFPFENSDGEGREGGDGRGTHPEGQRKVRFPVSFWKTAVFTGGDRASRAGPRGVGMAVG